MSGIYLLRIGKYRYVGQAKDFQKRWATHRRDLESGQHHNKTLQKAFRGKAKFSIVCRCPGWQLDGKEVLWARILSNVDQRKPGLRFSSFVPCWYWSSLVDLFLWWILFRIIVSFQLMEVGIGFLKINNLVSEFLSKRWLIFIIL